MAKQILGLDLGTNSIGWGVVDDLGGGEFELIKRGVHIFPEAVNRATNGSEESKASKRTGYRSARRIKFRRKLRKIETLKVLSGAEFCPPLSLEELKSWQSRKVYPANPAFRDWCKTFDPKDKESGSFENPYYYRWLAATQKMNLDDEADRFKLGRAFYHLAQRRGFKSNRLDTTQESKGVVQDDIDELSKKMDGRTLGQYFWEECYQTGEKIRKVHTSRDEHYLAEFEFICEKQGVSDELKKALHRAIFFQRSLKSQKGLVASCPFEPKKKRAPVSHPLFEEFRMWQTLNNIKIKTQDDEQLRPLTEEEKSCVLPRFFLARNYLEFKDIANVLLETLNPKNQKHAYAKGRDAAEAHVLFNYRDNQSISGCPFSAKLRGLFGDDYQHGIYDSYCGEKKSQKSPEDILHEVWHVLFSFDKEEKVKAYAKGKLGLNDEAAEKFAKIDPPQGYGALSLKAVRKILPFLKQGLLYSHAVFFANIDQVIDVSADETEKLKSDISKLIDDHNQYLSEARCVNEFVREYKNSPQAFEEKYDLRNVQDFEEKLPKVFRDSASSICQKIRFQTLENNGNGEYAPTQRLDERVRDYLKKEFDADEEALKKLYHPSKEETYKPAIRNPDGSILLGDPRISSIRNPVFMRAMHRVKAVVNELLKKGIITGQTKVHIEMARELNDANRRAAIKTWQWNDEKRRKGYKSAIEEVLSGQGIDRQATEDEILKYQLWEEQKHVCLYTGQTIKPSDFIGGNPRFDIEHTIPRSQSCDNSQENKTLCDRDYNREVKGNRIPFDCPDYATILQRIGHWEGEVDGLTKLIEKQRPKSKYASTKEIKDSAIQKRLVWEHERDYLRGKVRRFKMDEVTSGFKNSQLVDTRIITKYAQLYLKTVFPMVHTVNGKTTDDFRRCWGLQNEFGKKDRSNHAHHTVDAIVVACVTRDQYDKLAHYYHDYESYDRNDPSVPAKPHFSKPWKTFTEDMKELKNEILVSHYAPNHLLKQTKKRVKVGGKRVLQQGKTARGSLHKETFYGAIKRPVQNKKTGETEDVIKYVVRKPVSDLKDSDLKKIVDDRVREIVMAGRAEESQLKKEVEALMKRKFTSDESEELVINQQVKELESRLAGVFVLPNKNGNPTPIKRVRVCSSLTNPIALKDQRDKSFRNPKPHREKYYVNNDGNYLMAVYEGTNKKGKIIREYKLINNLNAANEVHLPSESDGLQLLQTIQNGQQALLFKDNPEELMNMSQNKLGQRLYIVRGLDDDGIKLYFNREARMTTEVVAFMNEVITEENRLSGVLDKQGEVKKSKLTTPKGGDVIDRQNEFPYVKFKPSKFKALLAGVDFKMNFLGEIEFMEE